MVERFPRSRPRVDGSEGPNGTARDAVLELDGVARTFGTEATVEDLSLSVYEGELLTLLGPSGCGKTTTLRLLAGIGRPDAGTIRVRGLDQHELAWFPAE